MSSFLHCFMSTNWNIHSWFFYVLHANFNNIADKWFRRAYNSENMSEHAIFQHDASLFFYPTLFFPFSFSCATSLSSLFQVGTLYFCSLHINNIHAVIRVERDEKNHDIWSTLINCFISFWNVCYFSRERHAQHKSIIAMM